MRYIITEQQYNLLCEGPIPPTLMKLFGAKTARKIDQIFAKESENIESFFAKIIEPETKILVTKSGQQYLKSSIGLDVPTEQIKRMIDLATEGKITLSNIEQFISLLPEKFNEGSAFRENIRKLLQATINRVEKDASQKVTQRTGQNISRATAATAPKTNFVMANSEESGKLAGWFDQKFYESGDKRHSLISDAQFLKMLPETKEYLKTLYERLKTILPNSPNSRIITKSDRDVINAVTHNYWGGFGRYGELFRKKIGKETVPSLPKPTKTVEDNLNSIFPSNPIGIAKGENYWTSKN